MEINEMKIYFLVCDITKKFFVSISLHMVLYEDYTIFTNYYSPLRLLQIIRIIYIYYFIVTKERLKTSFNYSIRGLSLIPWKYSILFYLTA